MLTPEITGVNANGLLTVGVHMMPLDAGGGTGEIGLVGPYMQASSGDWMLWGTMHPADPGGVITAASAGPPAIPTQWYLSKEFDSKAMRKFEFQADKLWIKVQASNALAINNWSAIVSTLVKTS